MKVVDVKICGSCDELVERMREACPSCTSRSFIILVDILGMKDDHPLKPAVVGLRTWRMRKGRQTLDRLASIGV